MSQSGRSDATKNSKGHKGIDLTEELPVVRDCVLFRFLPVSHNKLLCNVLFPISMDAIVTNVWKVASLIANSVHLFESVETA